MAHVHLKQNDGENTYVTPQFKCSQVSVQRETYDENNDCNVDNNRNHR